MQERTSPTNSKERLVPTFSHLSTGRKSRGEKVSLLDMNEPDKFRTEEMIAKFEDSKAKLEDKLDKTTMKLNTEISNLNGIINFLKALLEDDGK
jgi:hypothetical protein